MGFLKPIHEIIAYAEEEGNTVLHYSNNDKLVLIEILDFRSSLSEKAIQELLIASPAT